MRMFSPESVGSRPTADETLAFLSDITPQLIAYASNDVIKKYGKIRVTVASTEVGMEMLFAWEGLIKAMRKDLGHSPLGLQDGDVLRLFVNDIDEVIAGRRTAPKGPQ